MKIRNIIAIKKLKVGDSVTTHTVFGRSEHGVIVAVKMGKYGVRLNGYVDPIIWFERNTLRKA